ncbi:hypothetical protein CYLTODRAFT_419101 [Cylindrobasidium torrendii FP15055 ss-10]|uniref:Mediator of RNA polymerase II transcription subunit 12 n=1 Tax=Cylindrobasidium torrendii FP15055 ss-10 TaxID=1314674 RepID=A0A0D7BKK6_9AGAR|nr:hypothetical protein CYLTODRAFT_419101 [Cylindrobasidium torrendii FP15055 ss-10]
MRGKTPNTLALYQPQPPQWLPETHKAIHLGYPLYDPAHANQPEDVLSEQNVSKGYTTPYAVEQGRDWGSANGDAAAALRESSALDRLQDLVNQVYIRRSQQLPPLPNSSFRVPGRLTLNDSKRQAWFADLANPDVPLTKLGKNVPHGAKGHDLLELMYTNNIAMPRAVWFLRVFGANETAGLRNKPNYNPTQYSIEWAGVVTSYIKKQLSEITLPSAPRPGVNIKQSFKGVLHDKASRERWVNRFAYCLSLLKSFYTGGMVDHRVFLSWLVGIMASCNLAQAAVVARIAEEYLDDMTTSRPLAHHFVDACLARLAEIAASPSKEHLLDAEALLVIILQRLCIVLPDAFVSPKLWHTHQAILASVMAADGLDISETSGAQSARQVLENNFQNIRRRNEAMLFVNMPQLAPAQLGSSVQEIKLLNSISKTTNMSTISFFTDDLEDTKRKLDLLLTWCVTPLQFGDHRAFAAVTLLMKWRQRASNRTIRRPDQFLQDELFKWLDRSEVAADPKVISTVSMVFGKLVDKQLFSYDRYIQRLVARSEPGLAVDNPTESRHRAFLRCIPVSDEAQMLSRRNNLYGVGRREVPEDANEKAMRKELRTILPLFSGTSDMHTSTTALYEQCSTIISSPRFDLNSTMKGWLLPALQKCFATADITLLAVVIRTYCIAVELMAKTKCYSCLLQLTLTFIEHAPNLEALAIAIDTIRRYVTIWTCMDVVGSILHALQTAYIAYKSRGTASRILLSFIMELDNNVHLSEDDRRQIVADEQSLILALHPHSFNQPITLPDTIPEILGLASTTDPDAPVTLASTLWAQHRSFPAWVLRVWGNTVSSLRHLPAMFPDLDLRRACALRYADFLLHIDEHNSTAMDDAVLKWFSSTAGRQEFSELTADVWDGFAILLLSLVVRGILRATTIMQGLVYPVWQLCASVGAAQYTEQMDVCISAANYLAKILLLSQEGLGDIPPVDMFDIQRLQARRADVYSDDMQFKSLVESIPIMVSVENNEVVRAELREDMKTMRLQLCEDDGFREGTFRNLEAVREAFEDAMKSLESTSPDVGDRTMNALQTIFSSGNPDGQGIEISSWPEKSSMLSPWMISATTIQFQLSLKQMERSPTHADATKVERLDTMIKMMFDHSLSPDERGFMAQMTHGAGSTVAGKLINNGLRHVTDVLRDGGEQTIMRVGDSFRILVYIADPLRREKVPMLMLQPDVQDALFKVIVQAFEDIGRQCEAGQDITTLHERLILMTRVLQFDLGFEGVWTPNTVPLCRPLCDMLFKVVMFSAQGENFHSVVFSLLFDTLLFLIDETPPQNKTGGVADIFSPYPSSEAFDLDHDIPPEEVKRLRSLLSTRLSIAKVANLASVRRDNSGHLVDDGPVINRPWEWIEHIGEPVADAKELEREKDEKRRLKTNCLVKNTGSLPLETFGARVTGDAILESRTEDPIIENALRTFEDGVSTDSVFKRDWREARLPSLEEEASSASGAARKGKASTSGMQQQQHEAVFSPGGHRSSPTASTQSWTSGRRGSPNVHSSASEVIDVDALPYPLPNRTGTKRKATASVSDDEVVIIEGPLPSSSKSKKGKSVASKTKARKK